MATAAAALAAVVLVVGCSGGSSESGSSDGGGAGGGVEGPAVAPGDPGAPAVDADADADRQVVTTARASVAVDDPAEGARAVSELVESAGGRVEERSEQSAAEDDGAEGAYADLVVRVPADELTEVLAELEDLGDVANVSVSRSDVTTTAVDLDARISALETSVARLQGLLEGAATTEALLSAEDALSERQAELESLQSQRALLADQVEMSTLSVHLEPFGVSPAGGPDGFLDGLATGWRALTSAVGAAVVVLGVLLPWLLVAGLLTGVVLVVLRSRRRTTPPPAAARRHRPPSGRRASTAARTAEALLTCRFAGSAVRRRTVGARGRSCRREQPEEVGAGGQEAWGR